MSGREQASEGAAELDRRTRKTEQALLGAFAELFIQRRYDEIRVGDIVEEADVGRSTLYEHYRDKDELLIRSMSGFFDVLADAAREASDEESRKSIVRELVIVLDHFWQNRDAGRYLLSGPPARHLFPRLTRELAQRIEVRLQCRLRERGGEPRLPLRLIALQASEAQFGLIKAWLRGDSACSPAVLADGLRRSTLASVSALLGSAGDPDE